MSYRSSSSRAAAFDQALREAMSAPVTDRITTEPSARPAVTAGADIPESHAPYRVAPVPAVLDHDSDAADRDGVERHFQKLREQGEKHYLPQKEFDRQARLRRWQETRG